MSQEKKGISGWLNMPASWREDALRDIRKCVPGCAGSNPTWVYEYAAAALKELSLENLGSLAAKEVSQEKKGISAWLGLRAEDRHKLITLLPRCLRFAGVRDDHAEIAAGALEELSAAGVRRCVDCPFFSLHPQLPPESSGHCSRYGDYFLPSRSGRPSWCKPGPAVVIISDELSPDNIEDDLGDIGPHYTDKSCQPSAPWQGFNCARCHCVVDGDAASLRGLCSYCSGFYTDS